MTTSTPDVLPNLRDVGGLPLDGGGRSRCGVLLRSAAPHPGDVVAGVAWPPSDVVDLRSPTELAGEPHPLAGPGIRVHAVPLLSGRLPDRAGDWSEIPDLATAYRRFLASGTRQIVDVLGKAVHAPGPVLVHCAAGKDRTGIVVAVLLRAAGVSREAVTGDYTRTAEHLGAVYARENRFSPPSDPTHAQRLMGAPPEAIAAVLDELDSDADGAAGWLRVHGAARAEIEAWRARVAGT